jgi:hypothetical protein
LLVLEERRLLRDEVQQRRAEQRSVIERAALAAAVIESFG